MRRRGWSWGIAAALLAGCAGGPRPEDPPPSPVSPASSLPAPAPAPAPAPDVPPSPAAPQLPDEPSPGDHAAYRRMIRERKLIDGWSALDTEHYLVLHDDEVNRRLVQMCAKAVELVRTQFLDAKFPLPRPEPRPLVVRICKDADQYAAYGGPGGSSGYVDATAPEIVFYEDESQRMATVETAQSLVTGAHLAQAAGRMRGFAWFRIGVSEWAGSLRPVSGGGLAPDSREIRRRAAAERHVLTELSLTHVLAAGDEDPPEGARVRRVLCREFQVVAADAIDFLLTSPDPAVAEALRAYYAAICGGASNDDAVATAFRGIDLAALDAAWRSR